MGAVEHVAVVVLEQAMRAMHRERVFRDRENDLDLPDDVFKEFFRLPKPAVMWLCDRLRFYLSERQTVTTRGMENKILLALRYVTAPMESEA